MQAADAPKLLLGLPAKAGSYSQLVLGVLPDSIVLHLIKEGAS